MAEQPPKPNISAGQALQGGPIQNFTSTSISACIAPLQALVVSASSVAGTAASQPQAEHRSAAAPHENLSPSTDPTGRMAGVSSEDLAASFRQNFEDAYTFNAETYGTPWYGHGALGCNFTLDGPRLYNQDSQKARFPSSREVPQQQAATHAGPVYSLLPRNAYMEQPRHVYVPDFTTELRLGWAGPSTVPAQPSASWQPARPPLPPRPPGICAGPTFQSCLSTVRGPNDPPPPPPLPWFSPEAAEDWAHLRTSVRRFSQHGNPQEITDDSE